MRDAFDRIAAGTERLLQRQSGGVLTVSTSPNFAAKWLVHRLGRFAEVAPEIDLKVSASLQHVDFAREDIDLAIRHGDGNGSGLPRHSPLRGGTLSRLAVRSCSQGRSPLRRPSDLAQVKLLHVNDRQDAGINGSTLPASRTWISSRGPVLNQASMAIDAAVDAQGVALARTALAAWDLIGGRLDASIRRWQCRSLTPIWIVCPKTAAKLPKIVAFE